MGIAELILAGNNFGRTRTQFIKPGGQAIISASTQAFGGQYVLLKTSISNPQNCRIRLYTDESSMILDAPRAATNFNVSESVGLIADIVLNPETTLTLNPPLLGTTVDGGNAWYHISGSLAQATITIDTYPIGLIGVSNGTDIRISGSSISNTGYGVSGSITTPKGFIILSGSTTTESRLRLYSAPLSEIPQAEMTRSFGTASLFTANLIADMMFDSGNFAYKFVPLLEAYNWQNNEFLYGTGRTSYILENRTATALQNITASLHIYTIED